MKVRFTPGEGLQIAGVPLAIDAGRVQPVGVITHAHTDHSARHQKIICTPETALLLGTRWRRLTLRAVPYRKRVKLEDVSLTFYPAGHVLGSAMVLLEVEGKRILYTGDLRTTKSTFFSGARPISCDILVIEATYGRPQYKFPPPARTRQLLRAFVDAARASGYTPVLTGYALGKAQELVAMLADYREPIWVHPKIADFCEIYRKAGVNLPQVEIPTAGAPPGALVVMPPNFDRLEWLDKVNRPRICFFSGWAIDRSGSHWHRYDQIVPLSAHADCESLIHFARATGAKTVYTCHGFASELAELLRVKGIDAAPVPASWERQTRSRTPRYSADTLDLFDS